MVDYAREQVIEYGSLAKRLKVSKDTIRRWIKDGLEHDKIGAKVFTSLEAVNRWRERTRGSIDKDAEFAEAEIAARRRGVA